MPYLICMYDLLYLLTINYEAVGVVVVPSHGLHGEVVGLKGACLTLGIFSLLEAFLLASITRPLTQP